MTAIVFRRIASALLLVFVAVGLAACGGFLPKSSDNRHNQPLQSSVVQGLKAMGSSPGEAMVIRIFKQEQTLEVWKRTNTGQYRMFKTYEICAYSGDLGPKFREGDRQSPEGFYTITPGLMNPKSSYYLSFNTGFPNKFDRSWGRTGSDLMVHGDCSSRGCYAMTDDGIAEIYSLARETFKGGNPSFQLQIFPFKMTPANMAQHASNEHMSFWHDIKDGYDLFELNKTPPAWDVCGRQYVFDAPGGGALDAMAACPVFAESPALTAKRVADLAAAEKIVTAATTQVQQQAATTAALKEREQAISGFFGNMFGGKDANVTPVITGQVAPIPMPPINKP